MDDWQIGRRAFVSGSVKLGLAAVFLPAMTLAEACGSGESSTASTEDALARGKRQGYITLAFINDAPISFLDPKTGLVTGSGPAVATAILKSIGIASVQSVVIDFDATIPGLLSKRWDMSAFPFYIKPSRCAKVAFTNPTAQYPEAALVKSGNPLNIHSYADLASNSKIRVGIEASGAQIDYAKTAGVKPEQISTFPTAAQCIEGLRQGRIDAYLEAAFVILGTLKTVNGSNTELAKPFTGPIVDGKPLISYGGWAIRYEDVNLLNAFNQALATMLKSGELLSIQSPYGYTQELMPPVGLTAKDICPAAPWPSNYQSIK